MPLKKLVDPADDPLDALRVAELLAHEALGVVARDLPFGSHLGKLPRHAGALADQLLHDDDVAPGAVQLRVPPIRPDLAEPERPQERKAHGVLGEHARHELPEARALGRGEERLHRRAAGALSARCALDVHGELADADVAVARPVFARGRPRDDPRVRLDDHGRVPRGLVGDPALDPRGRARLGLESRDAVGDPLVPDPRDVRGVPGPRRARA